MEAGRRVLEQDRAIAIHRQHITDLAQIGRLYQDHATEHAGAGPANREMIVMQAEAHESQAEFYRRVADILAETGQPVASFVPATPEQLAEIARTTAEHDRIVASEQKEADKLELEHLRGLIERRQKAIDEANHE